MLALAVVLAWSPPVSSQVGSDGALETLPFELPFEVVVAEDGDTIVRVVDIGYEACVEHFRESLAEGRALASGWTVGGQGYDVELGAWRFSLMADRRTVYDMVVRRDARGCRIEVSGGAHPTPGGRWRWRYPDLELSDGTRLRVDPFVVLD